MKNEGMNVLANGWFLGSDIKYAHKNLAIQNDSRPTYFLYKSSRVLD